MELVGKGWKRPGMRSYDYGLSEDHDHDRRIYANMVEDYYGRGPKGHHRSDVSIEEEVSEILKWDKEVDASDITVQVEDGVVYLEGTVDSRHAKKRAEWLLDHIWGLHDVQNRLTIKTTLDLESDKSVARGDDGLYTEEFLPR